MNFNFQKKYFTLTLLLFFTEVLIAKYAHDDIIRPYVGDLLVTILLYCLIKSFFKTSITSSALSALLFSYLVEISQLFKLLFHLGLENSKIANLVLGNSFSWTDMLAYSLGFLIILVLEKLIRDERQPSPDIGE